MAAFRFLAAAAPLLFLALLASSSSAAAAPSIEEVCEKATRGSEYYGFCVSTLKAAAGTQGADARGLAAAATELSKENFGANLAKIQELLKGGAGGLDKVSERALRACDNVYGRGLSKLQQAAGRLSARDFNGASNYLSNARDDAVSCGDVFAKFGVGSLLQTENDQALKLTYVAIHVAQTLL